MGNIVGKDVVSWHDSRSSGNHRGVKCDLLPEMLAILLAASERTFKKLLLVANSVR